MKTFKEYAVDRDFEEKLCFLCELIEEKGLSSEGFWGDVAGGAKKGALIGGAVGGIAGSAAPPVGIGMGAGLGLAAGGVAGGLSNIYHNLRDRWQDSRLKNWLDTRRSGTPEKKTIISGLEQAKQWFAQNVDDKQYHQVVDKLIQKAAES